MAMDTRDINAMIEKTIDIRNNIIPPAVL